MSLDAFLAEPEALALGGVPVTVGPLTLRQYMRLAALADRLKGDLGLTREDLGKVERSASGAAGLLRDLARALVGQVDLDRPDTPLEGNALLLCREVGALLGCPPEAVADAPLDDLYRVAVRLWEVNAAGPLGAKLRATTATWLPLLELAKDALIATYQRELMMALRLGGTEDGGPTTSSSPSPASSAGPSPTSSTGSPPPVPSTSWPGSPTTTASAPPSPPKESEPSADATTPAEGQVSA